jgi:hypothetical protein
LSKKSGIPEKKAPNTNITKICKKTMLLGKGIKRRGWHSGKEVPNTDYADGIFVSMAPLADGVGTIGTWEVLEARVWYGWYGGESFHYSGTLLIPRLNTSMK